MLKIGFGKTDITPRVGVEMSGFGPFITRHSTGIHDRLWAKAMAVSQDGVVVVVVSCDLIEVEHPVTAQVRALVCEKTGLLPEAVMLHCTHTHSGPAVCPSLMGWGEIDQPYMHVLAGKIAAACIAAVEALKPATLSHAEVPCEGIGYNRQYDQTPANAADVLDDSWRPARPELTDTTCHVLAVHQGETLAGFCAYFSCHPVVCCAKTRDLHGDYCGVAMRLLEAEHPETTGLFLQGALGDVNTGFVHQPRDESMRAVEIFGARFAEAVRGGLAAAQPIEVDQVSCVLLEKTFSRAAIAIERLEKEHGDHLAILHKVGADDTNGEVRMSTIMAARFGELAAQVRQGTPMTPRTELQGIRLGPIALLATPFEVFQAIKRDALAQVSAPIPLVMSVTNDAAGYAPDTTTAGDGENYTNWTIPIVFGTHPYAAIHRELVEAIVELDGAVHGH